MKTLCLFRCQSVTTFDEGGGGPREYRFWAQYDTSIPEQERFAKATPSAEARITVDNPLVKFEIGALYYFAIEKKT